MQFENIPDPLAFDDVCLLFDDSKVLLAHRIVLSAASPVFKHVLEDSSQIKNTNIFLPSFDYTTMKRLVSFLYSGEAFLDSKEQLNEFIEYCDLFGLKAFKDVENYQVDSLGCILNLEDPLNVKLGGILTTELEVKVENNSEDYANFKEPINLEVSIDLSRTDGQDNEGEEAGKIHDTEETNASNKKAPLSEQDNHTEILADTKEEQEERIKMTDLLKKEYLVDPKIQTKNRNKKKHKTELNCLLCSYKTAWKGDLNKHRETKHKGLTYKCDKCDVEFTGKANLKRHKLGRHEGVEYNCQVCSYSTIINTSLKAHIKSKHDGIRFECKVCPDKFLYKTSLKKHIQAKHIGIRYNCQYCPKIFERLDNLKNHTNVVHYGSRFMCDIKECNFSATNKFEVKMHSQSVHEHKTFSCKKSDCKFETDTHKKYKRHNQKSHPQKS